MELVPINDEVNANFGVKSSSFWSRLGRTIFIDLQFSLIFNFHWFSYNMWVWQA